MNNTINNNVFGKVVSARRISRILAIQGVYSYLYAEEKNSKIIDYLSEQDLYNSADIIFFEDIFLLSLFFISQVSLNRFENSSILKFIRQSFILYAVFLLRFIISLYLFSLEFLI